MLSILYEDNYILLLDKPPGLQVEADQFDHPSLQTQALDYFKKTFPWKKQLIAGVVHRLDRAVSGVVLFAKTPLALKALNSQFEKREVRKIYLAVVEGSLSERRGELRHWLSKDLKNKRANVSQAGAAGAQECRLRYEVLEEKAGKTLVEIELLSGRYHQIRVQFAAIGHPVLGDEKYDSSQVSHGGLILLHARRLAFRHPKNGEELSFEAPLPVAWSRYF